MIVDARTGEPIRDVGRYSIQGRWYEQELCGPEGNLLIDYASGRVRVKVVNAEIREAPPKTAPRKRARK